MPTLRRRGQSELETMTELSPEEAARAHAEATVAGDVGQAVRDMTPDALMQAMTIGNKSWDYTGYELTGRGQEGDDHVFDILYHTKAGSFTIRDRFRQIDGVWRVVDVARVD
jgi:hypothetical protein